jgi:peptide/nickel transport system substrate-binding protein
MARESSSLLKGGAEVDQRQGPGSAATRQLSRREFLGRTSAGAAVVGSAALLAGCGSSGSAPSASKTTGKPRYGGRLRAAFSGGTSADTLNPFLALSQPDFARSYQLFDELLAFDQHAVARPALAVDVTPNANATEWTIRLRDGVTFHNGKPLTADDVVYTFRYILNPKSLASGASAFTPLDGPNISKIDRLTLRVPCHTPFSTFPQNFPIYYNKVVPEGYNPKLPPVGTGPFKYKSFTPGVQSVFVRNENYWQEGLPYVDEVVISDYPDETSQTTALLSAEADIINNLTAASVASVEAGGGKVLVADAGGFNPFTMRVDAAPFRDVRVRQALRLVVDRPAMLATVFGGRGTVANDLFSPYDPVYDHEIPQRHQDLDQAKFLLRKAGYEGLSVELVTAPIAQGTVSSAVVLAQQASGAGIKVNVNQITTTDFFGPNILHWVFAQDYYDYYPYFPQCAESTITGASFSETHFNNPRYDELYRQAQATTDESKRIDIGHEMQMIDYNEGGYIIPYFPPVIDAYRTNVRGAVPGLTGFSFNNWDLKVLWFE